MQDNAEYTLTAIIRGALPVKTTAICDASRLLGGPAQQPARCHERAILIRLKHCLRRDWRREQSVYSSCMFPASSSHFVPIELERAF